MSHCGYAWKEPQLEPDEPDWAGLFDARDLAEVMESEADQDQDAATGE
jgi:hypothetical protein